MGSKVNAKAKREIDRPTHDKGSKLHPGPSLHKTTKGSTTVITNRPDKPKEK